MIELTEAMNICADLLISLHHHLEHATEEVDKERTRKRIESLDRLLQFYFSVLDAEMPGKRKLEYNCMCDCLPCKMDGNCAGCNLNVGGFKPGDLCREGDNADWVDPWNECFDAWLAFHMKVLMERK